LHDTVTAAASQWVMPPGAIQVNGLNGGTGGYSGMGLYNLTIRRGIDGDVDFNLPVDQYFGYGIKGLGLSGSPTLHVWNYAIGGTVIQQHLKRMPMPIIGSYMADHAKNFTPRNVCAAFVNFGHNGAAYSCGKRSGEQYEELADLLMARFPRVAVIMNSQNPATAVIHAPAEPFKKLKMSHVLQEARKHQWGFLDIHRVFLDHPSLASLTDDGLHPNDTGSALWAQTIVDLVQD
jgi:hypothetical protein